MNRKKIITDFVNRFNCKPLEIYNIIDNDKFTYQKYKFLPPEQAVRCMVCKTNRMILNYYTACDDNVIAISTRYTCEIEICVNIFTFENNRLVGYSHFNSEYDFFILAKILKVKWANCFTTKKQTSINIQYIESFIKNNFFDCDYNFQKYLNADFTREVLKQPQVYTDTDLQLLGYFKVNKLGLHYNQLIDITGKGNVIIAISEVVFPMDKGESQIILDLFLIKKSKIIGHRKFI